MRAGGEIELCGDAETARQVCDDILGALPGWFGPRDVYKDYLAEVQALPTFLAVQNAVPVGLLTLLQPAPATVGIHLMAVMPRAQGAGVGTALVERAQKEARHLGARFLTVKTLGPSHASPEYARTRGFYARTGFHVVEEFPDFWGPGYPMQLNLKCLEVSADAA